MNNRQKLALCYCVLIISAAISWPLAAFGVFLALMDVLANADE